LSGGLYPWRTGAGNIGLPSIMGFSKAEQRERVNRVMDLVDLGGFERDFRGNCPAACSNARALRALAFDADILLMDEPFGALDVVRDHLNEQLLSSGRGPKKTIAFVTHSIPEAGVSVYKVVVMSPRPGRITD
jgi:NitT/TauT family transport system ATP-binding protein